MAEFSAENVMRRTRVANARYVIERVRNLGRKHNPSSRLMVMHRVLQRDFIPPDDSEFLIGMAALLALMQGRRPG
jgi:hypothetical protein